MSGTSGGGGAGRQHHSAVETLQTNASNRACINAAAARECACVYACGVCLRLFVCAIIAAARTLTH